MVEVVSTEYVQDALENDTAAVVLVYSESKYDQERIPGSINVPQHAVGEEFPNRFDTDDEIILYCGMETCFASPRVAARLESMGFENVKDYEGGLATWKDAGLPTAGERGTAGAPEP